MVQLRLESIAQEAMDLNLAKEGYTAFYVDGTDGLDTYPGDSWDQPFKTIQHAVDEAGSWAKIFVKAGTYAENVHIPSSVSGVTIRGQSRDTTIIDPVLSYAFLVDGTDCRLESLTADGQAGGTDSGVVAVGARFTANNLRVGNYASVSGVGIYANSEYSEYSDIILDSGGNQPGVGIYIVADHVEIYDCLLHDAGRYAIRIVDAEWASIHNNTIDAADVYGGYITGTSDYNVIYHNNFITSVIRDDTVGKTNRFIENFYSDHITDANFDGLCDTPYRFTTGADYQPVANRDGWDQRSLSAAAIHIDESFGTTYFVGLGGNDSNTGQTWAARRLTIPSGYGLCSSGDTLVVGPGKFVMSVNATTDNVRMVGSIAGLSSGTDSGTTLQGPINIYADANTFENMYFLAFGAVAVDITGDYNIFRNCVMDAMSSYSALGIRGGAHNLFDKCDILSGHPYNITIAPAGSDNNIFRSCTITESCASTGTCVDILDGDNNIFMDCVLDGGGTKTKGFCVAAGTHNLISGCTVGGATTPYDISANKYVVGCHEGSLITTNNTIDDDLKTLYDDSMVFHGTVTTYTDTTHCKVSGLAGFGNDYFGGPNNNWYVYAVRDIGGAGALPQGEHETISDYVSSDGTFTHTAFTTPLAVGDEILIVHPWAKAAAGGDATAANQTTIITDVGRQVSMMEFWSEIDDIITLTTATTNVAFPSIIVSDIPAGATVIHANCMIKPRAINNTFASVNAINGDIALQVKENIAGVFTDAIKLNDNSLSTAGSTKEGGLLIIGKYDCSGEVDENDTYTMRSIGNSFVDGDSLELIDVVAGIRVYFVA